MDLISASSERNLEIVLGDRKGLGHAVSLRLSPHGDPFLSEGDLSPPRTGCLKRLVDVLVANQRFYRVGLLAPRPSSNLEGQGASFVGPLSHRPIRHV